MKFVCTKWKKSFENTMFHLFPCPFRENELHKMTVKILSLP